LEPTSRRAGVGRRLAAVEDEAAAGLLVFDLKKKSLQTNVCRGLFVKNELANSISKTLFVQIKAIICKNHM
jgi:hypothetical protein